MVLLLGWFDGWVVLEEGPEQYYPAEQIYWALRYINESIQEFYSLCVLELDLRITDPSSALQALRCLVNVTATHPTLGMR